MTFIVFCTFALQVQNSMLIVKPLITESTRCSCSELTSTEELSQFKVICIQLYYPGAGSATCSCCNLSVGVAFPVRFTTNSVRKE